MQCCHLDHYILPIKVDFEINADVEEYKQYKITRVF